MNWTTQKPTAPGWYWMRNITGRCVVWIGEAWVAKDKPYKLVVDAPNGNFDLDKISKHQWAGPIPEPEEV